MINRWRRLLGLVQRAAPKNIGGSADSHTPDEVPRQIRALFASPELLPMRIDVRQNEIGFIQMSPETYRQSPFLDRRAVRAAPGTVRVKLDRLLMVAPKVLPERPAHIILHGAFCGSTLLSRYLEELPNCLAIREPQILTQLLELRSRPEIDAETWRNLFELTMTLLERGFPIQRDVVIKAADHCNWMGELFLKRDDRVRIVFLASPLRIFLLQALKIDHRRQWLKDHVASLRELIGTVPFLSGFDPTQASDAQRAAAMWLLNGFICASLLERFGSSRVLTISGEDLIRDPASILVDVADYFHLLDSEAQRRSLIDIQPSLRHAKDAGLTYDADARLAELEEAASRFGDEVASAMAWAKEVGSEWWPKSPFPPE